MIKNILKNLKKILTRFLNCFKTEEMKSEIESFIETIDGLTNKAFSASEKLRIAGRENGLGYFYLGRCVSCFMGVKTLLYSLNYANSQKDFAQDYINNLPASFPRKDAQMGDIYIKETFFSIRFVLLHNFYSQTEFTYRIILRDKFPEIKDKNPFNYIAERYGIMPGVSKFINDIRNTIHNNGHYFPSDNKSKEHIFLGKTFKFTVGQPINDVTMTDILNIINYILDESIKLFEIEDLALIEFNE